MRKSPTLDLERELSQMTGAIRIAGLDEAGRGALAGPVYAAAVILPRDDGAALQQLTHVNDSKLLSAARREKLFAIICRTAMAYGIGQCSAHEIDRIGIVPATCLAMKAALDELEPAAEAALVDGRIRLNSSSIAQQQVIRGDSLSLSIAAASILAKVSRDRHMRQMELGYPEYGFARHKGYGTAAHMAAIDRHGPCAEHRLSFAPFRFSAAGS